MSYIYFPRGKASSEGYRFPWLLFLFVGLALLVVFQWPLQIHNDPDDYNVSQAIPLPDRTVRLFARSCCSCYAPWPPSAWSGEPTTPTCV